MRYKINGKEIKLLSMTRIDDGTYSDRFTEKINELIQALGEPVEEKPPIKAPFYSKLTGKCLGYRDITMTLGENETWEEPKKWDRRELEVGDDYWCLGIDGSICQTWFYKESRDKWRQESGNCFKTSRDAENYKQKLINENK